MSERDEVAAVLRRARELVLAGWCHGYFRTWVDGRESCSLVGAILVAVLRSHLGKGLGAWFAKAIDQSTAFVEAKCRSRFQVFQSVFPRPSHVLHWIGWW
jgi:hypothetical protein